MAYHVPFNQRNRKTGKQPPVYIGFEPEPGAWCRHQRTVHGVHYANQRHYRRAYQNRRRFNWTGFWGFVLAVLSPFTAFLLAPVALLVSLSGLRRPRRAFAFLGTLLSLGGTAILATIIFAIAHDRHERVTRIERQTQLRELRVQRGETSKSLEAAATQVEKYVADHEGFLPAGVQGNRLTISFVDAWETELRYETGAEYSLIRSAGPDQEFETRDDLIRRVDGKSPGQFISNEL